MTQIVFKILFSIVYIGFIMSMIIGIVLVLIL